MPHCAVVWLAGRLHRLGHIPRARGQIVHLPSDSPPPAAMCSAATTHLTSQCSKRCWQAAAGTGGAPTTAACSTTATGSRASWRHLLRHCARTPGELPLAAVLPPASCAAARLLLQLAFAAEPAMRQCPRLTTSVGLCHVPPPASAHASLPAPSLNLRPCYLLQARVQHRLPEPTLPVQRPGAVGRGGGQ